MQKNMIYKITDESILAFLVLKSLLISIWLDSSLNRRAVSLTVVAVRLVRTLLGCIAEKRTDLAADGCKCTKKFWKKC